MYAIPNEPLENSSNSQGNPIGILSGDSIYLVFPNGRVEFIPSQGVAGLKTRIPLHEYRFWGYLEIA